MLPCLTHHPGRRKIWPLCVLAVQLLSCETTKTQVIVHIDATPTSLSEAQSLRVRVCNQREQVFDATLRLAEPAEVTLPRLVPIVPANEDAPGVFALVAELLDPDGQPLQRQRVISGFSTGRRIEHTLRFESSCQDVFRCSAWETCVDGQCVDSRAAPELPAGPFAGCGFAPRPLLPWNGATTGSAGAPASPMGPTPLRPRFVWEPLQGASRYELQVDHGCTMPGFDSCAFSPDGRELAIDLLVEGTEHIPEQDLPLSEGSQPLGRRYYWRVRGCSQDGCSDWSAVRYVDVGRLFDDFNGDGHSDVLVGAPTDSADSGAAFVFYGSAAGLTAPGVALQSTTTEEGGFFGRAVAVAGDVNGDGFADALVGANAQSSPELNEGVAYLYMGAEAGLAVTEPILIDNPEDQPSAIFGDSLSSAGDVNADGYADFIIGAREQNSDTADNAGAAHLYLGGPNPRELTRQAVLLSPTGEAGGQFGISVSTAGDINGDGFADVVVGGNALDLTSSNPSLDEGGACVYVGSPAGIVDTPQVVIPAPRDVDLAPGGWDRGHFGMDVAHVGDVDGDGFGDVVVGQPSPWTESLGYALLYKGSADGMDSEPSAWLQPPPPRSELDFGWYVSGAGDVNGDGLSDLVVGAPLGGGLAFLFLGAPADPLPAPMELSSPGVQNGADYGASVGCGQDIDGDGLSDVVVGSPLFPIDGGEGAIFVFLSTSEGEPQQIGSPISGGGARFGDEVSSCL